MIHLWKDLDLENTDFECHYVRTPSAETNTIKNLKLTLNLGNVKEIFLLIV